jgi:chromosomal replication initiator protein
VSESRTTTDEADQHRDDHDTDTPAATDSLGPMWSRLIDGLPASQRAWLTASHPLTLHGNTMIVAVKDDFTRGQLETRLRPRLEESLSTWLGRDIRLAVTVDAALDVPAPPPHRDDLSTNQYDDPAYHRFPADDEDDVAPVDPSTPPALVPQRSSARGAGSSSTSVAEARLNPKYLFETFVIGSSNRFAHAAAVAVAEAPGQGVQPAARLRRLRARQDPPAARDRSLRAQPLQRLPACATCPARSSPTTSSTRSATTGHRSSSAATARSTSC